MSGTFIIVKNVKSKLGGQTVLHDISFQLAPQQHLAITGASGSGKTTLAKTLAGHMFHEGSITIETNGLAHKNILFVEQHNQFKNLSNLSSFYYQQRFNSTESEDAAIVEQELNRVAENIISDKEQRAARIHQLLTQLGIAHRKHTPLIQLSNGENKRFQLIKALLHRPQVLILDNPFTGIDVQSRSELHHIINHLATHTTIILITGSHELPDCITHIAELSKGKLTNFCERKNFKEAATESFFTTSKNLPPTIEQTDFNMAVDMRHTSVQYGDNIILQHINWQVYRSDKWLVKGPNGAGKSTLLSLINGDNPQAYANEIYLFDKRRGTGESIWDIKKRIGYVSPELHWYFEKNISVYQAVASGFFDTMGLYRQLTQLQQQTVAHWLAYFNLTHMQQKPLSFLSSGLQRLVLLARALVKDPPLLILDEPCQGLDEQQTANFISLIDELCTQHNKTLIYVSHYEHEVPNCINKKLELNRGIATISNITKQKMAAA